MRSTASPVAVAAVAVAAALLAGCTLPGSAPTSTPSTVTGVPVPTDSPTPTPRPTPGAGQLRLHNDYDHGPVRVRVLLVRRSGSLREVFENGSRGDRVEFPGPGRALWGGFRGSVADLSVDGAVYDRRVGVPANDRRTVALPERGAGTVLATVVDLPYLGGHDPEKIVIVECDRGEVPVSGTGLVSEPDLDVRCQPVETGATDEGTTSGR